MLPQLWLLAILFSYTSSAENKFVQILSKPYFIDKTLLIERFLTSNTSHIYISNPRRFGKTINLAMIEQFCKIQVDRDGMPVPYNSSTAYSIFKDLKIRQHRRLFGTHIARYPVLSLSFLRIGKRTHRYSIKSINAELAEAVDNILWTKFLKRFYQHHRELFAATSERDLKFLGKLQSQKLNRHEMENGLFIAARLLYHYFDRTPVIILIDDYDQPALNSHLYENSNLTLAYDLINNMIHRALYQGPKYIRNILISGVTSLSYSHRDLLAEKIVHVPFLEDHPFTPFYGLTRSDLFELFDRYECDLPERKAIRKYYKAYHTSERKDLVYNTYSLTRYFINRNIGPYGPHLLISYWRQSEMEDHSLPLINSKIFRHLIKDLVTNRSIKYRIPKVHPKDALFQLQRLQETRYKNFEKRSTYLFMKMYFEFGYLAYGQDKNTYIIPNIEVRQTLKHQIRLYQQAQLATTVRIEDENDENDEDEEGGDEGKYEDEEGGDDRKYEDEETYEFKGDDEEGSKDEGKYKDEENHENEEDHEEDGDEGKYEDKENHENERDDEEGSKDEYKDEETHENEGDYEEGDDEGKYEDDDNHENEGNNQEGSKDEGKYKDEENNEYEEGDETYEEGNSIEYQNSGNEKSDT